MIDWRRQSKITQQTGQRKAYSSLKSASSDETVSSGNVKSTGSANSLLFKEWYRRTVFCSVHLQRADGKCTKSQALLSMPFPACNSVAVKPELNLSGMVINPFTDNLVLKIELIQKLHEADEKMAKQPKQIKMTPQQFQAFVKNQTEFSVIPKRLYTEKAEFVQKLCDEKEAFVNELLRQHSKSQNFIHIQRMIIPLWH